MLIRTALLPALIAIVATLATAHAQVPAWARTARLAGYDIWEDLDVEDAERLAERAEREGISVLEIDPGVTNTYAAFQNPGPYIQATARMAAAAAARGIRTVVYMSSCELYTEAGAPSTVSSDHPDWLQRDSAGNPAVFDSSSAFWIPPGAEDVWLTPLAPGFRQAILAIVAQLAATGVDGIFIDTTYWMAHFEGWEDRWPSFDATTAAEFTLRTGLQPPTIFDLQDPSFRAWVEFRFAVMEEYIAAISTTAKAVTPGIQIIVEEYPGPSADALRVGLSAYRLLGAGSCDLVTHEWAPFDAGEDGVRAFNAYRWLWYHATLKALRAADGASPSWLLSYGGNRKDSSWLAMAALATGFNFWEARAPDMLESVSRAFRRKLNGWIEEREQELFLDARTPDAPVTLLWSPESQQLVLGLDEVGGSGIEAALASFTGMAMGLLRAHAELHVITPRELTSAAAIPGSVLVLPNVPVLSDAQAAVIRDWVQNHSGYLVATGPVGLYDELGAQRPDYVLADLIDHHVGQSGTHQTTATWHTTDTPGRAYIAALDQAGAFDDSRPDATAADQALDAFIQSILVASGHGVPDLFAELSPFTALEFTADGGDLRLFAVNYAGQPAGSSRAKRQKPLLELAAAQVPAVDFEELLKRRARPAKLVSSNGGLHRFAIKIKTGGLLMIDRW